MKKKKTKPENGICFSVLYDKAFDKGLIGIDEQYKILLSKILRRIKKIYYDKYFALLEKSNFDFAKKYLPKKNLFSII